jgi:hypothetical protein
MTQGNNGGNDVDRAMSFMTPLIRNFREKVQSKMKFPNEMALAYTCEILGSINHRD